MLDFSLPAAEAMKEVAELYCISFDIGGGSNIKYIDVAV